MEWYKKLYVGEQANKKKLKLLRRINEKKLALAYIVTLPSNPDNVLDIIPYAEILQKHYRRDRLYVVGLGASKDEATQLAVDIVWDTYRATGNCKVSQYILGK